MRRFFHHLTRLNYSTIRFNFRYFPFRQAIRFPVLVSRHVLLKDLGGQVRLEGDIFFGKVQIGFGDIGIFDARYSRSIWQVGGTVVFKGAAALGHGTRLSVGPNGVVTFGANFAISAESAIVCHKKVTFGDDCLLSWENLILDTDMHPIRDAAHRIINEPADVTIGDKTWIGCRCTILKGSVIPPGSVLAAGTIVSRPLDGENAVYGTGTVRKIREGIHWDPF